jgi:hypothetical protein
VGKFWKISILCCRLTIVAAYFVVSENLYWACSVNHVCSENCVDGLVRSVYVTDESGFDWGNVLSLPNLISHSSILSTQKTKAPSSWNWPGPCMQWALTSDVWAEVTPRLCDSCPAFHMAKTQRLICSNSSQCESVPEAVSHQHILPMKFFFSFFFYYSYVHTRLGSFLPPAPTPSLTTHSPPNTLPMKLMWS